MQRSYNATDVPFKTLRALGGAVKEAMLPDAGVETASMQEGDFLNIFSPDKVEVHLVRLFCGISY